MLLWTLALPTSCWVSPLTHVLLPSNAQPGSDWSTDTCSSIKCFNKLTEVKVNIDEMIFLLLCNVDLTDDQLKNI